MKFGNRFLAAQTPSLKLHYVRYGTMKLLLKSHAVNSTALLDDASNIRSTINRRLTPVDEAMEAPVPSPLSQFFRCFEEDLKGLNAYVDERMAALSGRSRELLTSASAAKLPAELSRIEAAAVETCSDAVRLDRFILVNFTALIKVWKKHDKLTGTRASPAVLQRLATAPFLLHRFDVLVVTLSDTFASLRARRDDPDGTAAAGGVWVPPSDFERATTKYWVRPEDVLAVKCALLRNLPVLVFGRAEGGRVEDAAAQPLPASDSQLVSSVYLDNAALDVYHERLERAEGATLIRLRWYGDGGGAGGVPLPDKEVYVERKTHHESWTVDTSVKERFRLKAKHIAALLRGELDIEAHLRKLRGGGASEADVARTRTLVSDILSAVSTGSLAPALRTSYYRTAFQSSVSNAVRVSLDTQLRMIDERVGGGSSSGFVRSLDPASPNPVTPCDVVEFPYAILEVKLQAEPPEWVEELLASGMLTACTKFSKFLHGSAALRPGLARKVPHWWDDQEVLPPAATSATASSAASAAMPRIVSSASIGVAAAGSVDDFGAMQRGGGRVARSYSAPACTPASAPLDTIISFAAAPVPDVPVKPPRRCISWNLGRDAEGSPAAPAKRHVPIKIEPKTFFANERTLLQWLHISVLILFTSLSLVTSVEPAGGPNARGNSSRWALGANGQLAGAVLAPVPCLFIIYALWTYMWRAARIARREPSARYDDRFGPVVLVLLLLSVVITSIALTLGQVNWQAAGRAATSERGLPAPSPRSPSRSLIAPPLDVSIERRLGDRAPPQPAACGLLPLVLPPFTRLRGAGAAPGPEPALLLGSDFALYLVSLRNLSDVRALLTPNACAEGLAAGGDGAVFLASANGSLLSYSLDGAQLAPSESPRRLPAGAADAAVGDADGERGLALAAGPDGSLLYASHALRGIAVLRRAPADSAWVASRLLAFEALGDGVLGGAGRLAAIAYDQGRGLLHLLYPRAGVGPLLRTWSLEQGVLRSEWRLPAGAWSGLALGADGEQPPAAPAELYLARSYPAAVLRIALGAEGLPNCL